MEFFAAGGIHTKPERICEKRQNTVALLVVKIDAACAAHAICASNRLEDGIGHVRARALVVGGAQDGGAH